MPQPARVLETSFRFEARPGQGPRRSGAKEVLANPAASARSASSLRQNRGSVLPSTPPPSGRRDRAPRLAVRPPHEKTQRLRTLISSSPGALIARPVLRLGPPGTSWFAPVQRPRLCWKYTTSSSNARKSKRWRFERPSCFKKLKTCFGASFTRTFSGGPKREDCEKIKLFCDTNKV